MIGLVLSKGEILPLTFAFPGDREARFTPELAASALTKAADAYERKGSAALSFYLHNLSRIRHRAIYLFDETGKVLAGDNTPPPFYGQLASITLLSSR